MLCPHKEKLEELVLARTKELEEALQVKSRFLAIMSHGRMDCLLQHAMSANCFFCFVKVVLLEIRTPLSGIMGCMALLDQSELTPEQNENVRISQVCGEQLLLVIDDILDLTKLEVRLFGVDTVDVRLIFFWLRKIKFN
jgi:signal transduction histidine kinase